MVSKGHKVLPRRSATFKIFGKAGRVIMNSWQFESPKQMGSFVQVNSVYLLFLRIMRYCSDQTNKCFYDIVQIAHNVLSVSRWRVQQTAHCLHVPDDISDIGDSWHRIFEEEIHQSDDTGQHGDPVAQVPVNICLDQLHKLVNRLRQFAEVWSLGCSKYAWITRCKALSCNTKITENSNSVLNHK